MKPIRVLHVLDGLKSGGAETFIMNIYRKINREKIQFDFLIRNSKNNVYLDEINKLGGRIYFLPQFPKNLFRNLIELKSFLNEHREYNVIHVHANSLVYIFPLIFGNKIGIENIIIHSHSTHAKNSIAEIIHYLFRPYAYKLATKKLACSKSAGKWMYGNREFDVIKNAIDAKRFRFNKKIRQIMRKEMNLENKLVIGHIGRFVRPKNHKFLLRVFKKVYELNKDAVLLLIGDGPLRNVIKKEIANLRLDESVYLLGVRKDIHRLLQVFDLFLFPSLFEGLPFTLIEAQAAGLPCLISDTITDEVIITNNVRKLSLSLSIEQWANELIEMSSSFKRLDTFDVIRNSEYDINHIISQLEQIYKK